MARTLLDNEQWDFGSNCFVCEPKNTKGIGIRFYLEDAGPEVVADFTPESHHSGAPNYAHGGLSMALIDEGMAWAVIAIAHRFGITKRSELDFVRPVRIGQPHTARARIESRDGHDLIATASIEDAKGRVCVSARATFYVMTKAEADAAIGQSQQSASYTRASSTQNA